MVPRLRLLLKVTRVLAFVYLGLCTILFLFQRSLIYFPQPFSSDCGTTISLPIQTGRVLVCARPREGRHALIYFGGNAEDVSFNMHPFSVGMPDRALYLLNYRGYGGSSGKPSQSALFQDALTLFDRVHFKYPDVEVVGRSLGSGVAIYLASSRPIERLVLVTPYNSIQELAARRFPYLPVGWLLLDKFESWRFAPFVRAPTLIIAADHDDVVPRDSTELLRSHFKPGLASMVVLAGTGHDTIADGSDYLPLLSGASSSSLRR